MKEKLLSTDSLSKKTCGFFQRIAPFSAVVTNTVSFFAANAPTIYLAVSGFMQEETENESVSAATGAVATLTSYVVGLGFYLALDGFKAWIKGGEKIDNKLRQFCPLSLQENEQIQKKDEFPSKDQKLPKGSKLFWTFAGSASLFDAVVQGVTVEELVNFLGAPFWVSVLSGVSAGLNSAIVNLSACKKMRKKHELGETVKQDNSITYKIGAAIGWALCAGMAIGKAGSRIFVAYETEGMGPQFYLATIGGPVGIALQGIAFDALNTPKVWGEFSEGVAQKMKNCGLFRCGISAKPCLSKKELPYQAGKILSLVDSSFVWIMVYFILNKLGLPVFGSASIATAAASDNLFQELSAVDQIKAKFEESEEGSEKTPLFNSVV